jgi:hypothetical protein
MIDKTTFIEEFKSNIWYVMNEFFEGKINWEEVKKRIDKLCDQM